MNLDPIPYAMLTRLHGISGALGLAILLHPVLMLGSRRAGSWWTRFTAELAAVLMAAPFVVGWLVYPTYRTRVKPALGHDFPAVVLRFETKEHLAAMAVTLVVAGALMLRVAGDTAEGRRASRVVLAWGWVLGLLTALLGIWVGGHAHPGW